MKGNARLQYTAAIVLFMMLDVRKAFNSATPTDMLGTLQKFISLAGLSLMSIERLSKKTFDALSHIRELKGDTGHIGIARGSILGPDLWNSCYDKT